MGTLSPWRLKGLPPLKQTWNDLSLDRRFHGLARRVELHRLNLTLNWKCLHLEHGLLMWSKNGNQSHLHFRECARRPSTWSQKTRLPTCQRKRWSLGRSLPTTSPQWRGILHRTKIVAWLTVTLRFVLSVLVRWVWTWRSSRLCTLTLSRAGFFGAPVGRGGGGHKVPPPPLVKTPFPFSKSTQAKFFWKLVQNWVLWSKLGFNGNHGYGFKVVHSFQIFD